MCVSRTLLSRVKEGKLFFLMKKMNKILQNFFLNSSKIKRKKREKNALLMSWMRCTEDY